MDRTSSTPPTGLGEPCPPWCVREHEEHDHEEDRYHHGEVRIVPVIVARGATPAAASFEPVDLVVCLGRHAGEEVEWVRVEATERPEPRLVLTRESAHLLAQALLRQLEAAG